MTSDPDPTTGAARAAGLVLPELAGRLDGIALRVPLDSTLTQAHGNLVKVFGWYDNEWGYTHRLLDLVELVAARGW